MDKMPVYLIFLQSMPEAFLLVSLGSSLLGFRLEMKKVLAVALIMAVAAYFVRALPLIPGMQVLIMAPVMVALTALLCRLDLKYAITVVFLGLLIISAAENIFSPVISAITGISIKTVITEPGIRLLFPLPEFSFLAVLLIMLRSKNIVLFNIPDLMNIQQGELNEK